MENDDLDRTTGQRVAANVRRLREAKELRLVDLSERMTEVGVPMTVNTLSKIELGRRAVDVDDLVALALGLRTSPNRLLLGDDEDDVVLTPSHTLSPEAAWAWALGEAALDEPKVARVLGEVRDALEQDDGIGAVHTLTGWLAERYR